MILTCEFFRDLSGKGGMESETEVMVHGVDSSV